MAVIDRDETPRKHTRFLTTGEIEREIAGIRTGLEMDGIRFLPEAEAATRSVLAGEVNGDEVNACRLVRTHTSHEVGHECHYPGTKAPRNLLGYNPSHTLEQSTALIVAARMAELASNPIEGRFDFAHLQAIHRYLFNELYEWAGNIRTTNARPCLPGVLHAPPTAIQEELLRAFGDINSGVYLNHHTCEHFVHDLAGHWGDLTVVHPFPGGNSTAQKVFFDHLARTVGWAIEWREISTPAAQAARHFAYVDGGKTLADVLRPAINPVSQTPPEFMATASRETTLTPNQHWEAMIKHYDTMPEQPYT